ncbi:MAG TPA: NAD(+)/NADH kinase [Candidatus Methylacidiphilales bacterium]
MKIGVVANQTKPGTAAVVAELHDRARSHRLAFLYDEETAPLLNRKRKKGEKAVKGLPLAALAKKIDLLLVIGGDGSLLRVVHGIYPSPVPILGVNLGRLGFLTALRRDELDTVFSALLEKRLRISPRHPLSVRVFSGKKGRGGKKAVRSYPCALNEIVLSRSGSRMSLIRLEADGAFVNEYIADGLILATATGSTAYSLAAGGPILTPEAGGIFVNPICPHTLSNRGLLLPGEAVVRVMVPSAHEPVTLLYDGVSGGSVGPDDIVELKTSKHPVNLAFLRERDFFQILRQKLRWSGAAAPAEGL